MATQSVDATKQADRKWQTGLGQRGRGDLASLSVMPFDLIFMNPFSLMRRMTEEMDRVFQNSSGAKGGTALWAPAVEVCQTDDRYVVRAELPGLTPDDVAIAISDDGLVLEGERGFERDEGQNGVYRTEIRYGRFYRVVPLPEGASPDGATATLENGILKVTVPLAQPDNKRRQIQIDNSKAGSAQGSGKAAA
jgi:HSP20 family protein